jgi:hypothetical protein
VQHQQEQPFTLKYTPFRRKTKRTPASTRNGRTGKQASNRLFYNAIDAQHNSRNCRRDVSGTVAYAAAVRRLFDNFVICQRYLKMIHQMNQRRGTRKSRPLDDGYTQRHNPGPPLPCPTPHTPGADTRVCDRTLADR